MPVSSMIRGRASLAIAIALSLGLVLGACNGDGEDRPGTVTEDTVEGGKPGTVSNSGPGPGGASASDDTYKPVSDVDDHAEIGEDAEEIRELLAVAKEDGGKVAWDEVGALFEKGENSKKSDGSVRSFATLVEAPDVVEVARRAIAGTAAPAGAGDTRSDAVRAQVVDKALIVLLARKTLDELSSAAEKVAAGQTDDAGGAPHNVDEAWAFFTAEGQGVALTADKRAADFKQDGKVREPIIEALTAAQKAAQAGEADTLSAATSDVEAGLDRVFYLATFKYLDHGGDEIEQAEGATFYLAIAPQVKNASPEAHTAIVDAFAGKADGAEARRQLNAAPVLQALGIGDDEKVESLPS